ncbi:MAG: hypothetical protein ACRDZ6_03485, partial [Acidimicrobiales bacterium]
LLCVPHHHQKSHEGWRLSYDPETEKWSWLPPLEKEDFRLDDDVGARPPGPKSNEASADDSDVDEPGTARSGGDGPGEAGPGDGGPGQLCFAYRCRGPTVTIRLAKTA